MTDVGSLLFVMQMSTLGNDYFLILYLKKYIVVKQISKKDSASRMSPYILVLNLKRKKVICLVENFQTFPSQTKKKHTPFEVSM